MTTPTPHGAPELPENIREGDPYDNARFEELCREHDIWGTAESAMCAVFWRTAIQQAAGAVPETQKAGSSDHLVPCAGGGVTQPLTDERLLVSFLRNTTVFHQSDTPEWLYARDGDGNSASIRASEIVSAIRNIIKEHS